mmetsp:Transcript_19155/g.43569  ORF Transcript_19155/g.43569 Transcript_19155/m.43569 type:complete len:216 (+) Transcript_19155:584-1231(+)
MPSDAIQKLKWYDRYWENERPSRFWAWNFVFSRDSVNGTMINQKAIPMRRMPQPMTYLTIVLKKARAMGHCEPCGASPWPGPRLALPPYRLVGGAGGAGAYAGGGAGTGAVAAGGGAGCDGAGCAGIAWICCVGPVSGAAIGPGGSGKRTCLDRWAPRSSAVRAESRPRLTPWPAVASASRWPAREATLDCARSRINEATHKALGIPSIQLGSWR